MSRSLHCFRAVRQPKGMNSSFSLVVVDATGQPHLPLTTFYHHMQQQLSDGTARTYLNNLLPFFSFLTTDEWRQQRADQWNSPPDAIQEAVRDYLIYLLKCKVQPRSTYAYVKLTAHSPSTVRLFLAALKQFYAVASREGYYEYNNPLLDVTTRILHDIEREERGKMHQMPSISGVEEPIVLHPSENFFRLADTQWEVHPIDNPELGRMLIEGFTQARLQLRDQIVVRMALETGARIREILTLTLGDWRARGSNQEAKTWSKGSRGRRIKTIRFSSTTARMLRQYINTDRAILDLESRRFEHLPDTDPLFLSHRHKPYDYEAFKPHWYKLCNTLNLDLNIHAIRHWYTTQAMRFIAETATNSAEIMLRKEELVRYMAWRSPETLQTYENYFKGIQHYLIQDQIHQRMEKDVVAYMKPKHTEGKLLERSTPGTGQQKSGTQHVQTKVDQDAATSHGWSKLLALGGKQ